MSELKELRRLQDEERALMNIASKLSDQLNRLKVEELALLNMIRVNEGTEDERETKVGAEAEDIQEEEAKKEEVNKEVKETDEKKLALVSLDLAVSKQRMEEQMEEEEEEDEEEMMNAFNDPV